MLVKLPEGQYFTLNQVASPVTTPICAAYGLNIHDSEGRTIDEEAIVAILQLVCFCSFSPRVIPVNLVLSIVVQKHILRFDHYSNLTAEQI